MQAAFATILLTVVLTVIGALVQVLQRMQVGRAGQWQGRTDRHCTPHVIAREPCRGRAASSEAAQPEASTRSLRAQVQSKDDRNAALLIEIADLKREATKYNNPSTYAKAAKLQRQVAAKEKELEGRHAQQQAPAWQATLAKGMSAAQARMFVSHSLVGTLRTLAHTALAQSVAQKLRGVCMSAYIHKHVLIVS